MRYVRIWVRLTWNWLAIITAVSSPGDFDRAHHELAIARRTLPNNSEAIMIAARIDRRRNRWDDSLANLEKASELDPRNPEVGNISRRTLLEMRRYHELEQRLMKDAASD